MQGNDRHTNRGNTASGEAVDDKKLPDSHSQTVCQSAIHHIQNELPLNSDTDVKQYKKVDGRVLLPRSIVLTRSLDHGFGFTLRHFIVYPPEPSSEVECLEEEVVLFRNRQEPLDTIFVKQVRVGSPAHLAGLTTGDRVLSVNEASTLDHSYQEIVAIIQTSHPSLRLIVISKENDLLQQVFSSTAHNPESNLNVKNLLFSACFQSSPWFSKSSLASLHGMPSTAPYHPGEPKPLPAPPPNAKLRPIIHSPTQKRKAPARHTSTQNSYYPNARHEGSSLHPSGSGRYTPVFSSQSQVRRKVVPAAAKDSTKRPLILDRKQAVYNIQNSLPFPLQRSSSEYNASRISALSIEQKSKEDPIAPLLCQTKDNGIGPLSVRESPKREGIYEPVLNKSNVIGDSKRLEKDPDGRLYEVVQTRFINSHMPSNEPSDYLNRLSPLSKSKTEGNIVRRKGCSQTLSPLLIHPSKAAKLEHTGTDFGISSDLSANRRMSEGLHNKENVASQTYVTDRSTQEAIERIKKNVEKKVEFLQRPSEPLWKPQSRDSGSLKEYFASPQKLQRSNWPPQESQVPPSPGTILKALAKEKSIGRVLLRTKSEIEGPRTVSFPSDSDSSRATEQGCLTSEQRSNSLPSSPTKSCQEFGRFQSVSGSTTQLHSPPDFSNPLIGNAVAKPYGKHLSEESSQNSKFKPFVSTLTRIHENIPSTNKYSPSNDNKTPTSTYGSKTPTITPMGSQASLTSINSLTTPTKSTPLVWVGDNDRIRQLQIVSTRAKKFESPNTDSDSKKTAFHRFELSRLSQRANAFNVADRKKEFERRESNSARPCAEPGLSFEFGTSLNSSQRQKRWKNNDSNRVNCQGSGLMKSLSDGGSVFSVSKEYLSLPEEPCSATSLSADPSLVQGSGNRMIPVGGTKIHCEPPEYQKYKHQLGSRPLNDTGILSIERDRSNSTCSQASKFAPLSNENSRRKSSPLIRQHSFHSIQAHLALTGVPESDLTEASQPPQPICEEGVAWPRSKHRRPAAPFQIQRPTFLDIKKHARPMADGSGDPPLSTENSSCMPPHDQGAVTSLQHRIGASGEALSSLGSHSSSAPNNAAGVTRRNKHLYGDENDRLVRRVSYLKATSGDRVYSDSEIDSEDEKQVAPSPASIARRALGGQGTSDLPSPASFQSSITTSGPLNVKLAKIHGKRAGDRSWKSVWAVVRGRALLLYKDKQQTMQTPLAPEDQVTLRGTDVAVALDYTKRRHVLRLSTPVASQFLLQAESDPAMTAWLTSLSAAAAEDGDSLGKHGAPIAEPELLSPDFESSLAGSAATTPTTTPSQLGGSNTELTLHGSDANASPPSAHKNAKKNSSQHKPKGSFMDQPSATKSRKMTGESWSSPKSKTWKGKLGRHLRKMQAGSSVSSPSAALPEGASIGVCLEDCPLSQENEFVPVLVSLCVGVVESKGLRSQGIYRVPGNRAAVTFLTEVVNRGANAIDLTDARWSDVNVISSLLKLFFRKLPDPLIASELYPLFIEASKIENPQQRLTELKHLVQELPDHHYETLRFLCYHLNNIIAHSADNKMDVRNLAIVFGPTLVRASDDNMAKMVTDMSHQCQIVETLLSQVNWFFSEEESDDPPPIIPLSVNPLSSSIVTDTSLNASELDPSSQSLLLSNVEKLEANHKDTKKLIVSSIISAANRRVQKVRKKVEEECSAISNNEIHHSTIDHFRDYCDSSSLNQQKVSDCNSRPNQSHHGFERLSGSNRDGRLFSDIGDTSFPSDEGLSSLSSLSSLNTLPPLNDRSINPAAVGYDGVLTASTHSGVNSSNNGGMIYTTGNNSSLSRSGPSQLGDETPIKSYAGLSASTQERIRRFETETRAMLQRDMTSHRRELDKQKIEEELQKAKKDMETEDIFDRMADNPSEVMHIMNDYRRKPSREVVSHPSLRSSASSKIKPCGLTNVSPAPTSAMTNSPFKNDKFSHDEQNGNQQHPHNEGSDLMSAITATFEEKMKLLQKSHLLASEREELSRIRDRNSSPEDIYRFGKDGNRLSSSGNGGTKCKLYRDPSLHRRRTTQCSSLISHSASSEALSNPYFEYGSENNDESCAQPLSLYANEELDCNFKEKNEKRTLESLRVETPEGLREKKPKELKRSDAHDRIENSYDDDIGLCESDDIPFSNRRDKRDTVKNSAELKSRRHNVRELKEKFEQNSKKTHTVTSSVHTTSHPSGYEKPAKKQSRKSRIKRRHTVGGMKDLARVAWLKVIEAAHYGDPQKLNQGCQMSAGPNQLPSWEQLQLFLEALAEGRKLNLDQQTINSWVVREKLENSNQDLESILSLVLPPQQKETLKRRLSVREPTMKPLCPVLESNV